LDSNAMKYAVSIKAMCNFYFKIVAKDMIKQALINSINRKWGIIFWILISLSDRS